MDIMFESERLQLKVFTKEDMDSAKTFWGDPEVMKYCVGATSHERLANVLAAYQKCHHENGISVYAVVEKQSAQVIGAAGFNVYDTVEKIELIYHFSKNCWGKGYASEAVKACLELAKRNNNIELLYASVDPKNTHSTKILEKIGFSFIEMQWFDDTNQEELYFEYKLK